MKQALTVICVSVCAIGMFLALMEIPHKRQQNTNTVLIEVKIIEERLLLNLETLLQYKDGTREWIKGDFGNIGDTFMVRVNNDK